ncbi:hypothetical protein [Pseudomonas sp. LRF_L74]|uniref:hypothetical protein n=1 Tax=Pseudomonas sp. LRF_L74 TaxID=3369422 RepID=UPI003F6278C6
MNPLTVLNDAFFFFSRHLGRIALLCLPLIALESLASSLLSRLFESGHSAACELLVGLAFYPLYNASLILLLDARSQRQRPSLLNLLLASLPLWPAYAVLYAANTLLTIMAASVFLLPAIWLMVKLAFSEYLLVLRGLPPLQAMRESFMLTTGHFWSLLGCGLLALAPLLPFNAWSGDMLGARPPLIDSLLVDCIRGMLQLFATVVLFRCFMLCTPAPAEEPGHQ